MLLIYCCMVAGVISTCNIFQCFMMIIWTNWCQRPILPVSWMSFVFFTWIILLVVGSYCPEGTDGPLSCPPGTYGAATGLRNVSECTACTAGSYCTTPGLTAPEGVINVFLWHSVQLISMNLCTLQIHFHVSINHVGKKYFLEKCVGNFLVV